MRIKKNTNQFLNYLIEVRDKILRELGRLQSDLQKHEDDPLMDIHAIQELRCDIRTLKWHLQMNSVAIDDITEKRLL